MSEKRLVLSLAERLYGAHRQWAAELSEADSTYVRWFALRDDLKAVYIAAAEKFLSEESDKLSSNPDTLP